MTEPLRNLPKHEHYANAYRRFGYFWGLGIEHETYVATAARRRVTAFTQTTMRPERYSVSYYKNYQAAPLATALTIVIADTSGAGLTVPVLMNNHSFTHCDLSGEHSTTYERIPRPNPRYAGRTLWDWITDRSPWLRAELGKSYMWDGDTVEFVTQRFYRSRVTDVLEELQQSRERFIAALNALPREGVLATHAPFTLAHPTNEPFASYVTNPTGVAMFNNGTIHINVTLPTRLNWWRRPWCMADFTERHRRLARLIQWMEPVWIAVYGSGDPLAGLRGVGRRYAAGSQRLAVSRYIGVGTFDTETMPIGKILQVPRTAVGPLPWYYWLHGQTDYAPLDVIGLDINFNKHWAHGLELRFFDQMSDRSLRDVLLDLVVLMDVAQSARPGSIPDPRKDVRWQRAAGEALYEGAAWQVGADFIIALCQIFRIADAPKEPSYVTLFVPWLRRAMTPHRRACWAAMTHGVQ